MTIRSGRGGAAGTGVPHFCPCRPIWYNEMNGRGDERVYRPRGVIVLTSATGDAVP
ncbi:MAG: hypothetical protein HC884_02715 [Chloroflexaceae bacterium]|nr:hypothetical protein [Chloroflexaceae bacterium]